MKDSPMSKSLKGETDMSKLFLDMITVPFSGRLKYGGYREKCCFILPGMDWYTATSPSVNEGPISNAYFLL